MKKLIRHLFFNEKDNPDITKEQMENRTEKQVFIDALRSSLGDLIKLNLISLVFLLPMIAWSFYCAKTIRTLENSETIIPIIMYLIGLIPCMLLFSNYLVGSSYVMRKIVREEHIWFWTDFWKGVKENRKQGFLYTLIFSVFMVIGYASIAIYQNPEMYHQSFFLNVLQVIIIITLIHAAISSVLAYPMMTTYKLKLKYIIKNSIFLTISNILKLLLYVLLAVVPILIVLFVYMLFPGIGTFVSIIYLLFFGISLAQYTLVSQINRMFIKHIGG